MANPYEVEFVDRVGRLSKQWGIGEPPGKLLGILFLSEKSLTQNDLKERSGYSLSLISPTLKLLEGFSLVSKSKGYGKEKLYSAQVDMAGIMRLMANRLVSDINPLLTCLEKAKDADSKNTERMHRLSKEYKTLKEYVSRIENCLP